MFNFRPHHLICNLCFQGKGYNEEFIKNFALINKTLLLNPDIKYIQIVNGVDDICLQCPKNKEGKCEDEPITSTTDDAYKTLLQLSADEVFSLNAIKIKVKKFLSINDFHTICGQCPWKDLCESKI